jgi:ABC-type lipoprotein release transport system permease subunit
MLQNLKYAFRQLSSYGQVAPRDPLTHGASCVGLIGVGLLACWLPERRATRMHPMEALRYE